MTIAAGLASIKAALDITKTLADARDTSKILEVRLELQRLLLEAQEAQSALIDEKRALEERIRNFDRWETERQRYALTEVVPGRFVYRLRPEAAAGEPDHSICPDCFEDRRKSVLTHSTIPIGRAEMLRCQACGYEVLIKGQDLRGHPPGGQRPTRRPK